MNGPALEKVTAAKDGSRARSTSIFLGAGLPASGEISIGWFLSITFGYIE
jgi:hypothetical protein